MLSYMCSEAVAQLSVGSAGCGAGVEAESWRGNMYGQEPTSPCIFCGENYESREQTLSNERPSLDDNTVYSTSVHTSPPFSQGKRRLPKLFRRWWRSSCDTVHPLRALKASSTT